MDITQPLRRTEISEERRNYLTGFMPLVRFVIPDERPVYDYHAYIGELLASFVESCDSRNAREAEVMRIRGQYWNQEYGIAMIYIDNEYVMHCKMYLYDGDRESVSALSNYEPWRGVMFRDHAEQDCRLRNTVTVFRISDAFEKFLTERGVVFERHNMEAR